MDDQFVTGKEIEKDAPARAVPKGDDVSSAPARDKYMQRGADQYKVSVPGGAPAAEGDDAKEYNGEDGEEDEEEDDDDYEGEDDDEEDFEEGDEDDEDEEGDYEEDGDDAAAAAQRKKHLQTLIDVSPPVLNLGTSPGDVLTAATGRRCRGRRGRGIY